VDEGPNSPPSCPVHPGAAVAATCTRCGRFCCEACLGAKGLCVTCEAAIDRQAVEARLTTLLRGLALGEVARVVLIGGLLFAARAAIPADQAYWVYLGAAATALPFLGLAVALWASGRLWLSWPALALDLLVFGAMAVRALDQPLLAVALLALPAASILRMVRLQKLAKALKQRAA